MEMDWIEADELEFMEDGENYGFRGSELIPTGPIKYTKAAGFRVLKHVKDVVRTDKESLRSEAVKDISLDDVIAEKKITFIEKKKERREIKIFEDAIDGEIRNKSLDDIIYQRNIGGTKKDGDIFGNGGSGNGVDKSLDEIIVARGIDVGEKKTGDVKRNRVGGGGYKRKLQENMDNNGDADGDQEGGTEKQIPVQLPKRTRREQGAHFVMTPLDVIDHLGTDGMIIELDVANQNELCLGRNHTWQCTVQCGRVAVTVDAVFKELARQVAAFKLIELIKEIVPDRKYPNYQIPEGCFYDPRVLNWLQDTAKTMGLDAPKWETVLSQRQGRDYYITTCTVGEDQFQGKSFSQDYSRLFAFKAAWETYSGKKMKKAGFEVTMSTGTDKSDLRLRESQATHALNVADKINGGLRDCND